MQDSITKSLAIKEKQAQAAGKQLARIQSEYDSLKTDIAVLKRAREIQKDLKNFENIEEDKSSSVDRNSDRTEKIVDALNERGDEMHVKKIAELLSLSKMAAKTWVSYQIKAKGEKCPWEFGKNKSWIKLKDPDMKKALASIF